MSTTEGRKGVTVRPARDLVFVSYSHADQEWMRRLKVMLAPVVRNQRLKLWVDEHILIGDEWRRDIFSAVQRARLAVCLITADFLDSRFIIEEELPALRKAGVRVVPVLVHACMWQQDPYLPHVKWAHDPGRDGPLDLHNEREDERERRLNEVCQRLLELLPPADAPGSTRDSPSNDDAPQTWPVEALPLQPEKDEPEGINGVPSLPPSYLIRDELDRLRTAVLADPSTAVGVTERLSNLGLAGQGGIGKTVLATALARDEQIKRRFHHGVLWVSLGEDADPLAAQRDLLRRLDVRDADVRSITQGRRTLREALAGRQCLLIVDDACSVSAAKTLAVTGPHGRPMAASCTPPGAPEFSTQSTRRSHTSMCCRRISREACWLGSAAPESRISRLR
ncbi:MAG: TIR domain-containing protein [Pseudonocardiaceae bacterium]